MKSNLPIDEAIYEEGYNQALNDNEFTEFDAQLFLQVLQEYLQDYIDGIRTSYNNSEFYQGLADEFNEAKRKK